MDARTEATEHCRSKRPRFFPDQLLTAEILNHAQDHARHTLWQLTRSLVGAGVVHGLAVKSSASSGGQALWVDPGLAIDARGRMIEIGPEPFELDLDDIVALPAHPPGPGIYTLHVHYAERTWPFVMSSHSPPYDQSLGWICAGVRFSLRRGCQPCDPCACPETERCIDACTYPCLRQGSAPGVEPDPALAHTMECPPALQETCDGWHWDPEAGVALACVEICKVEEPKRCEPTLVPRLTDLDPCTMRQNVVRNRQLFELIRECHLVRPRIEPPAWLPDWDGVALGRLTWTAFAAQCRQSEGGFAIGFTRPLRAEGVHDASVILSAVTWERRTDYHEARRIPLESIGLRRTVEYDGVDYVEEIRLRPTRDWLAAEIDGARSTLFDGALIELTLRGAMLRDRCGTMLDARPPLAEAGPEHARNGDDLVIAFCVKPRRDDADVRES